MYLILMIYRMEYTMANSLEMISEGTIHVSSQKQKKAQVSLITEEYCPVSFLPLKPQNFYNFSLYRWYW